MSPGSIDGHTLRVHSLTGLHALDLVALFVNRLPRDIKPDDLRLHLKKVTNLNDLMAHPLFGLMHGLPRMAEWCAELLNYTNMDQLYELLNRQPLLNHDRRRVVNNHYWPHQLPDEAKLLLRRCQALMLNKANTADRKKARHSHDTHSATNAPATAPNANLTLQLSQASGGASGGGSGYSSARTVSSGVSDSSRVGSPDPQHRNFGSVTSGGSSGSVSSSGSSSSGSSSSSERLWLPTLDVTPFPLSPSPSAAAAAVNSLHPLPLPPGITPTIVPPSPQMSPAAPATSAVTSTVDGALSPSTSGSSSPIAASTSLPPLPPLGLTTSYSATSSSSSSPSSPSPSMLSSVGRRSSSSSFVPLTATSVSFARREPSPPSNAH